MNRAREKEIDQMVEDILSEYGIVEDIQGHKEGAISIAWSCDLDNEFIPDNNRALDFS